MSYLMDYEPYVAVPTSISETDFQQIVGFFREVPEVQVVRTTRVSVSHLAAADPATISEIGYWIVNIAPELLRQVALWGLATYAGKKVVDGFATEAGKDLWKGVKALTQFIYGKFARDAMDEELAGLRSVEIRAVGRPKANASYFDVSIILPIPNNEARLQEYINDVEAIIYPFIGCLSTKYDSIRVRVDRDDGRGRPWIVKRLVGGGHFAVNPKARTFEQLGSQFDPPSEDCLLAIGLSVGPTKERGLKE